MTSTRKALVAAVIAVLFSAGLIFWQVKARKAEAVNLSADDMASFNVEEFGTARVRRLTHAEINERFHAFKRMTHFDEVPFERQ